MFNPFKVIEAPDNGTENKEVALEKAIKAVDGVFDRDPAAFAAVELKERN